MLDDLDGARHRYGGPVSEQPVRQPNPFRPGFNQPPAKLVGRDAVLAAAAEALEVAALDARTPRPIILVGPRGVGKTVSLGEIANLAGQKYGWPTVHVELQPRAPFTPVLIERLQTARALLSQATPGKDGRLKVTGGKVTARVLGLGAEVNLARDAPVEAAQPLAEALTATMDAALACRGGLVLTLDELQLGGRGELAALAAVAQQHVPDNWPLVIVAAGLPSLREPDRSVTYLERGEWHELGLLSLADARSALAEPARSAGRPMDERACEILANASGGYPYAVQVLGHHAWRASSGRPRIEVDHAEAAVKAAQADLSAGLYASRWADASDKEREYLLTLAKLPPGSGNADIARAWGQAAKQLSYLRDRLIKKGTLFPDRNALRFMVPGMRSWLLQHAATEDPGTG